MEEEKKKGNLPKEKLKPEHGFTDVSMVVSYLQDEDKKRSHPELLKRFIKGVPSK